MVRLRHAVPAAQLLRARGDDPRNGRCFGRRGDPEPVLLPRAGSHATAAGAARHGRDLHRQPGGDLGRVLDHPPGDPARLRAAAVDPPHQRRARRADLHPGGQLGADDRGDHAGAVLPQLVEPRLGLWRRGDRRGDDRHTADGRAAGTVAAADAAHGAGGCCGRCTGGGRWCSGNACACSRSATRGQRKETACCTWAQNDSTLPVELWTGDGRRVAYFPHQVRRWCP